jgi:hypothetical protein
MTLAKRSQPGNAQNSPAWPQHFQDERDIELARSAGHDAGCFNRIGRQAWWHGRDVNATLAEYDYRPLHGVDPMRVPLYNPRRKAWRRRRRRYRSRQQGQHRVTRAPAHLAAVAARAQPRILLRVAL